HVKTIQVGVHNSEFSQVASGVNPGEPIISSDGYALPDNTQIKIEAPGSEDKQAGAKKENKDENDEKADKAAEAKPAKKGKEQTPMDSWPEPARPQRDVRKPAAPRFHRPSRPLLFLLVKLTLGAAYLAFSIPVAVFPNTDLPRIVSGVYNSVMPIDQMLVTITRPLEEAVNNVPGLQKVTSVTSRGEAEIDLFFDWSS